MKRDEVTVKQIMYDDFPEHSSIKIGTATQWWNGEGMDISINRKNMGDIQISLTYDDVSLLRKMFSDFE